MECAWQLFAEKIDGLWPPVYRVAVHLKGGETVLFRQGQDMQQVLDKDRTTTLTAWFKYNELHADGRHLTYQEFPENFVFRARDGVQGATINRLPGACTWRRQVDALITLYTSATRHIKFLLTRKCMIS